MTRRVQGLGIDGFDEFEALVGRNPFDEGEPLDGREIDLPPAEQEIFLNSLEDPSKVPDLGPFLAIKAAYLKIMTAVFEKLDLDALVYPHATELLPLLDTDVQIIETTVSEVRPPPGNPA